jgi:hypothetical protein
MVSRGRAHRSGGALQLLGMWAGFHASWGASEQEFGSRRMMTHQTLIAARFPAVVVLQASFEPCLKN